MKVRPAQQDLERLRPYLTLSALADAPGRWQLAAKLKTASVEFRDKIFFAIIILLIGSIAESHLVRLHDRRQIENSLRRDRKVTRLIAEACRQYGTQWGSAPNELERALFGSIRRQADLEIAEVQVKDLRQGRPKHKAFDKYTCAVGEAYETSSRELAIVKFNHAHEGTERYSGPFAELLETVRADAAAIWKMAGFKASLSGPRDKNARLEYARKVMQTRHATPRAS